MFFSLKTPKLLLINQKKEVKISVGLYKLKQEKTVFVQHGSYFDYETFEAYKDKARLSSPTASA